MDRSKKMTCTGVLPSRKLRSSNRPCGISGLRMCAAFLSLLFCRATLAQPDISD